MSTSDARRRARGAGSGGRLEGWIDVVGIGGLRRVVGPARGAAAGRRVGDARRARPVLRRRRTWQDRRRDRPGGPLRPDRRGRTRRGGRRSTGPATLALLDEVEADVAAGARRLLDVGCGTGAHGGRGGPPLAATSSSMAVDASAGMLEIARARGGAAPGRRTGGRLRLPPGARRPAAVRRRHVRPRAVGVRAPARAVALPGAARDAPRAAAGRPARLRHVAPGRRAVRGRTTSTTRRAGTSGLEPRWDDDGRRR